MADKMQSAECSNLIYCYMYLYMYKGLWVMVNIVAYRVVTCWCHLIHYIALKGRNIKTDKYLTCCLAHLATQPCKHHLDYIFGKSESFFSHSYLLQVPNGTDDVSVWYLLVNHSILFYFSLNLMLMKRSSNSVRTSPEEQTSLKRASVFG